MLFTCAPTHPHGPARHAAATDHGAARQVSDGTKTLAVDFHCLCSSAMASALMKAEADKIGFVPLASFSSDITDKVNAAQFATIAPKMSTVAERIADMDKMGVDIQAISVPPYQYYYWAEPELGREVSRMLNDHLAETVASNPDRFVGLGTIPLQDTDMAIAEMERCINELGFRGVEISTNVRGEELSLPRLDKFFARAEELDILLFMHPDHFTNGQRLAEHYLINLIGNPLESTIAVAHLIFGGVLDRHPGLKLCIAHGGGFLPAYAARFDHGYHARDDCRQNISLPPTEYLKRLYFDTMVFEPDQLKFLIDKYGADHILLGTDYPFDMGHYDPHGLIGKVDGLSEDDRAAVTGLNAAKLLKLS